ncbi:HvfC family RiPP maturation protein [Neisseria montereyensis]|uniref:DNA-binding domain-containing protein n=1 Tax=Neisseria montereyensis TaxID=2973938 RepID=A0ABT2FBV3_9NEIS|nr:putative DNA-binding domain-containing protein [Neisseria montereyensis]MCS4533219.1 putative DNA-binding domain-containing protein [Neisseria montereyensis]
MQPHKTTPEKNSSADFQAMLADHVRDPSKPSPEGIEPERLAVYTRLVRNNLRSFLDLCFSDSSELADRELWQHLQNRFLIEARPESPFFNDIPAQFLNYARSRESEEKLPDGILAMMDFETALLHAEIAIQPISDGLWDSNTTLSWQPAAKLTHYDYNFVDSNLTAIEPTPSTILTWRNRDNEVYYRAVSGTDVFLLEHFSQHKDTFEHILQSLQEMTGGQSQDIEIWLRESIDSWIKAGVLFPEINQEKSI